MSVCIVQGLKCDMEVRNAGGKSLASIPGPSGKILGEERTSPILQHIPFLSKLLNSTVQWSPVEDWLYWAGPSVIWISKSSPDNYRLKHNSWSQAQHITHRTLQTGAMSTTQWASAIVPGESITEMWPTCNRQTGSQQEMVCNKWLVKWQNRRNVKTFSLQHEKLFLYLHQQIKLN